MEFFSERTVKGRKAHRCDACGQMIAQGEPGRYMAGKWEGDFWTSRNHLECRAAEIALNNLHGLSGGDEWLFLNDLDEVDDMDWLRANHPVAWERVEKRYARYRESIMERARS